MSGEYGSRLVETARTLESASRLVLACHQNPDGDALGSLLGLALGLKSLGKDVVALSTDGVPATYEFLPEHKIVQRNTERRDFEIGIGLDSGELPRTGDAAPILSSASLLIDIDHHGTAAAFGHIRLIDTTAASTAEIVFDLLNELGVAITPQIAQCLLAGVLTDTGGFRYPNTSVRALTTAARLHEFGARPTPIAEAVYESRSLASLKLLGRALDRLTLFHDGAVAASFVTRADFEASGATDEDSEGIVAAVRSVRGVKIAFFLRQAPTGKLRVSLRAIEGYDVASIAANFSGGGHKLASGCTLDGDPETAMLALVDAAAAQLAQGISASS